jgi:hypothetical protein
LYWNCNLRQRGKRPQKVNPEWFKYDSGLIESPSDASIELEEATGAEPNPPSNDSSRSGAAPDTHKEPQVVEDDPEEVATSNIETLEMNLPGKSSSVEKIPRGYEDRRRRESILKENQGIDGYSLDEVSNKLNEGTSKATVGPRKTLGKTNNCGDPHKLLESVQNSPGASKSDEDDDSEEVGGKGDDPYKAKRTSPIPGNSGKSLHPLPRVKSPASNANISGQRGWTLPSATKGTSPVSPPERVTGTVSEKSENHEKRQKSKKTDSNLTTETVKGRVPGSVSYQRKDHSRAVEGMLDKTSDPDEHGIVEPENSTTKSKSVGEGHGPSMRKSIASDAEVKGQQLPGKASYHAKELDGRNISGSEPPEQPSDKKAKISRSRSDDLHEIVDRVSNAASQAAKAPFLDPSQQNSTSLATVHQTSATTTYDSRLRLRVEDHRPAPEENSGKSVDARKDTTSNSSKGLEDKRAAESAGDQAGVLSNDVFVGFSVKTVDRVSSRKEINGEKEGDSALPMDVIRVDESKEEVPSEVAVSSLPHCSGQSLPLNSSYGENTDTRARHASDSQSLGLLADVASSKVFHADKKEKGTPYNGKAKDLNLEEKTIQLSGSVGDSATLSPTGEKKPSPSKRGQSDGSSDSIHRAGTPKSGNILSSSMENRPQLKKEPGAPELPDLKDASSEQPGVSHGRLSLPHVPERGEQTTEQNDDITPRSTFPGEESDRQKRALEETGMERPAKIIRQRSSGRPQHISHRQRSTGSRLSFADDVQIAEPGALGSVSSDRRTAPPPILRRGDRQQSLESLQPPEVIRAADRQFSVESFISSRSQESSSLQALTPNSRMTPSNLGNGPCQLSPSADTPNTERMEELYNQLDQYMDSPTHKIDSPGHQKLTFNPRPMNALRRQSSASIADHMSTHSHIYLKLGYVPQKGRSFTDDEKRSASGGLSQLEIPNERELGDAVTKPPSSTASRRSPPESHSDGVLKDKASRANKHQDSRSVQPAPLEGQVLEGWLSGSAAHGMSSQFPPPHNHSSVANFPQQAPIYGYYPFAQGNTIARGSHMNHPYADYGSPGAFRYDNYSRSGRLPKEASGTTVQNRTRVDYGHPRKEIIEGLKVYDRNTIMLWGAHLSDICPVNGNSAEGCDSLIFNCSDEDLPSTKDDLRFVQIRCSPRNGATALFVNYQRSQAPEPPHSYPVRVFRRSEYGPGTFRYDGLFRVTAVHDERGRPRAELIRDSKTFSFLLQRNSVGNGPDQNRVSIDEIWDYIQDFKNHLRRGSGREGGGGRNLQIPRLSHGGGGGQAYHGGYQHGIMEQHSRPKEAAPPLLRRNPSAEVSIMLIRYFDDNQEDDDCDHGKRQHIVMQQQPPRVVPVRNISHGFTPDIFTQIS